MKFEDISTNTTQISLVNFFIYNLDYGQKEGRVS
jgi:hypothetical protein